MKMAYLQRFFGRCRLSVSLNTAQYTVKDRTATIVGIHHPVRNFDRRVIAVLENKKEKEIHLVVPEHTVVSAFWNNIWTPRRRDFPGFTGWNALRERRGAVIFHDGGRYLLIGAQNQKEEIEDYIWLTMMGGALSRCAAV